MPRILIPLCFLSAVLTLGAEDPPPADRPLRLVCWNIHHGRGVDDQIDLPRIARVLVDLKPDLVALQEVDRNTRRSGSVDQAAELARLTGMQSLFGRAMDFSGGQYGLAILHRLPVTTSRIHPLPGPGEPRIAFEAEFKHLGRSFSFCSIHLDHQDAARRLNQAKAAVAAFQTRTHPVVIAGDFNDTPHSPPLQTFAESRWLLSSPDQATHPAPQPATTIDHFALRGFPAAPLPKVIPESTASDHRPLLLLLPLPQPPGPP